MCICYHWKVSVSWPSKVKHYKLKTELEPLGRTLLQGKWSDIARAVFRVGELRAEICKLFLKEIWKECCAMVSKKEPSLLRKSSAAEMQDLSLKKSALTWIIAALYCILCWWQQLPQLKEKDLNQLKKSCYQVWWWQQQWFWSNVVRTWMLYSWWSQHW